MSRIPPAVAAALCVGLGVLFANGASGQSTSLAPLSDPQGYAPAPIQPVTDHVFCVAGAPSAVYVSDAFPVSRDRTIDLVRAEWQSFMRRKDPAADFAACSHNLPDKGAAYRQRDAAAGEQLRARGLARVTYTGWIG